jgi:predicted nucleic acid-binding protein
VASLIFPDNTVLVNFALIGRVDLLETLVKGRAAWTLTISGECHRSAAEPGLEALHRMPEIFGAPLIPTPAERIDARLLRERIAGTDFRPGASLGEAEAIAMITSRAIARATFVSDDAVAREHATARGISVYSTMDLLRLAGRVHLLSSDDAWSCVEILRGHGRGVGRAPHDFDAFVAWFGG